MIATPRSGITVQSAPDQDFIHFIMAKCSHSLRTYWTNDKPQKQLGELCEAHLWQHVSCPCCSMTIIMVWIVQLAVVSGRVPVWPDVACDSPWLDDPAQHAQRGSSAEPKKYVAEDWRGDLEIVPRLPLDGPPNTRRCLVWYYYEEDCDFHVSAPSPAQAAQAARLLCAFLLYACLLCQLGTGHLQMLGHRACAVHIPATRRSLRACIWAHGKWQCWNRPPPQLCAVARCALVGCKKPARHSLTYSPVLLM